MCLKHGSLELFLQEMKYFVYKVLYMFMNPLTSVFISLLPHIKVWEEIIFINSFHTNSIH